MYKAFNLTDIDYSKFNGLGGSESHCLRTQDFDGEIKAFFEDGGFDGSGIQQDWFPKVHADIFISHAHKDMDQATGLANWLFDNFGLTSFIDSQVWGHADKLIKKLNDHYKEPDSKNYSYEATKKTSSHVHVMLSTALSKMIDACECVFFMNTPNSLSASQIDEKTFSPWIFYEVTTVNLIRKKKPKEHRLKGKNFSEARIRESLPQISVRYNLDVSSQMVKLTGQDLADWKVCAAYSVTFRRAPEKTHPLDKLYKKKGIPLC
ncbi:hypothetical protein [Ereboglobus luteus]|nr:hypothetical protein [Ereboglobus luteus]